MTAKKIAILGINSAEASDLCRLIEKEAYPTEIYSSVSSLEAGLAQAPCLAAILDVDSVPLDNHMIRNLKILHPAVSFLMVSRKRFHPELQESISHILYACLKKPADPDEISYLLNLTEKGTHTMARILPGEDLLIRMQRDIKRSLAADRSSIKWSMIIDQAKCAGCHACTIGCVSENKLPPGVVYRPVIEEEVGIYPNVRRRFLPRPCMHCQNPPCTKVCPVQATYQNEQGVVVVDYNRCIGCRYCLVACPYSARTSDFGEWYTNDTPNPEGKMVGRSRVSESYEAIPATEYGKQWPRRGHGSPVGNARKCHFCLHRVAVGMLPACVTTCVGRATFFGNRNDSQSLISELLGSPRVHRLKEELGTKPSVYYLQ